MIEIIQAVILFAAVFVAVYGLIELWRRHSDH